MVAIENKTGMVRAMVGGDDYAQSSFNLATQGQRQPGSSFKPFVLAEALRQDISPGSTVDARRKKVFTLKGGEKFEVNNYNDAYAGVTTLANATTNSDNSVYAELGLKLGPRKVARDGAPARHPHAGLAQRGELARRPQGGRHAARHGARVRDVRPARRADLRHAQPRRPDDRKVTPIPGPVGDRGDRPRRQGRLQAARGRRRASSRTASARGGCSRPGSPTRSARSCRPS